MANVAEQKAASDLYNKVVEMSDAKDEKKLAENAQAVKEKFSGSTYAVLSAFQLAKLAVDKNELDKAATELNWIITNHKDNELTSLAKIRLARIFIEQGKPADALDLVNLDEKSGYYALSNLVKGDALLALERKDEALEAYKIASIEKEITGRHPSLSFKVEALTGMQNDLSVTQDETAEVSESVEKASQETLSEESN